ncbi:MAG: hypothetical protein ABJE95_02130 [Byssovorax sp.]
MLLAASDSGAAQALAETSSATAVRRIQLAEFMFKAVFLSVLFAQCSTMFIEDSVLLPSPPARPVSALVPRRKTRFRPDAEHYRTGRASQKMP